MNKQQFIHYVETHQRQLRQFLTGLCCGDADLADDLAQDTLIKAYLSCESFRDDSKFSTWIYRIAYNTFISHRRSYKLTGPLDDASEIASLNKADGSFDYQRLHAALDKLSDKERMAILLYYLEGYPIREISEITDTTIDAVKAQLSRGRKHLKDILEEKRL